MQHPKILCALALNTILCTACNGGPATENTIAEGMAHEAQVDSDGQGNFMAVWRNGNAVFSRYYPQTSGGQPEIIGYGDKPRISMSNTGNAHVIWQKNQASNKLLNRHFDYATLDWTDDQNGERIFHPNTFPEGATPLDIAAFDDTAVVIWKKNYSDILFGPEYAQGIASGEPSGYSWISASANIRVATIEEESQELLPVQVNIKCQQPNVVRGSNRFGMMACAKNETDKHGLYVTPYNGIMTFSYFSQGSLQIPDINWRNSVKLAERVYPGDYDLVIQPDGRTIAIWAEALSSIESTPNRNDNSFVIKTATYTPADSSTPWSGNWSTPLVLTANAYGYKHSKPVIDMDKWGRAIAVWHQGDDVNVVRFANDSWGQVEKINSTGSNKGLSHVSVTLSPDGDALVVWEQHAAQVGGSHEIWSNRFNTGGNTWNTESQLGEGSQPVAALENNGMCVILWHNGNDIREYICGAPTAAFDYSPLAVRVNRVITFDASASRDDDGIINLYEWNFDDDVDFGQNGETTEYTFIEAGEYPVTLRVTDNDGNTNSISTTVTVSNGPLQTLSVTTTTGGTVTTQGIDCGDDCSEQFIYNTQVILNAVTDVGATFIGWSGDCSAMTSLGDQASVIMDSSKTCNAQFLPAIGSANSFLTLTVIGSGEVMSNDANPMPSMNCLNSPDPQTVCTVSYTTGTQLVLIPSPFITDQTAVWTGCDMDYGIEGCLIEMNRDREVSVQFQF